MQLKHQKHIGIWEHPLETSTYGHVGKHKGWKLKRLVKQSLLHPWSRLLQYVKISNALLATQHF